MADADHQEIERPRIDVWEIALSADEQELADGNRVLSPQERERCARLRHPAHRTAFVAAHAATRCILATYCRRAPEALTFAIQAGGKPRLEDAEVRFNLSHSGGLALLAVGPVEVGVDLECESEWCNELEIARRYFAAAEADALALLPPALRRPAFLRCWTRKEAYVKGRGAGLAMALDTFEVSLDAGSAQVMASADGDHTRWSLADLPVAHGYCAALANEGPPARVVMRPYRRAL